MLVRLADTWSEGWTEGGGSQGNRRRSRLLQRPDQNPNPSETPPKKVVYKEGTEESKVKENQQCRKCAKECLAAEDLGEANKRRKVGGGGVGQEEKGQERRRMRKWGQVGGCQPQSSSSPILCTNPKTGASMRIKELLKASGEGKDFALVPG